MAEARLAVEPTPALQHVGFEVDTSKKEAQISISDVGLVVYIPHPYFLWRSAKRSFWRTWHKVQVAFMPVPISVVVSGIVGVVLWVSNSSPSSWQRSGSVADFLWKLDSCFPWSSKIPTNMRVAYLAGWCTLAGSLAATWVQRVVLRRVLAYHGWIYERQKKSLKTKIWGFILKNIFFRRIHNKLDAYHSALPTLPFNDLNVTVSKYLTSVKPLLEDRPEDWTKVETLAKEFLINEGPQLQRYLKLKWLLSDNYISDWWLNYVYLRSRSSLCINSNWYGLMYAEYFPTHSQSSRAAAFIFNLLKLRKQIETGEFEPQMLGGFVPLCMHQYEKVFSTTRIPGREQDILRKYEGSESKHIVVICNGQFYRMLVYNPSTNKPLTPLQLQLAISGIISVAHDNEPKTAEALIPSLTAAERTRWADIRETHFEHHEFNKVGLEAFEKAVFVLCLDDETPTSLSEEGKQYLCGNGSNRWSDKSFNLVITPNGKAGIHVEHSWGDAPTLAHILEWVSTSDEVREWYDEKGDIKPCNEDLQAQEKGNFRVFPAERIRFTIDSVLRNLIEGAHATYQGEIDNLDLDIGSFTKYGKGVCKKAQCSPDGWLQMAMQLAYYRDQGHFDLTYESSMTRLFKLGRTETIRSVSAESKAFVMAMENGESREKCLLLLRLACEQHQKYSHDAMTGCGVDRHLFGLVVVAYGKHISSPFLRSVFDQKWKLSTSQVLTKQVPDKFHPTNFEQFHTPNGGFGPVADDGYGVSYCVFGENRFYFNVSSKKSSHNTHSTRFLNAIFNSLIDMGKLMDE